MFHYFGEGGKPVNNKQFPFIKDEMKIENVRKQMVKTAMQKGLSHPSTIKLSQQLDGLLNGYNKKSNNSYIKW